MLIHVAQRLDDRCVRAKHVTAPRSCGDLPHGNGQATSKHAVCCCCAQRKHTIRKKKVKLLHSIPSAAVGNNINTHTPDTPPNHVLHRHTPLLPGLPPQTWRPSIVKHRRGTTLGGLIAAGGTSQQGSPASSARHAPPRALLQGRRGRMHTTATTTQQSSFVWMALCSAPAHHGWGTHTRAVSHHPQQEQGSSIQQHNHTVATHKAAPHPPCVTHTCTTCEQGRDIDSDQPAAHTTAVGTLLVGGPAHAHI